MVGISLQPDGFSLAYVLREEGAEKPQLKLCEFRPVEDASQLASAISAAVKDHNLQNARCVCVLPQHQYSLRMVDAPQVSPEDMAEAAKWQIQDLIDFKIEEAVSDAVVIPPSDPQLPPKKVYVAAARENVVSNIVELLEGTGLELHAIGIAELAIRNIVTAFPENARGTAFLQLTTKGGLLTMTQDSTLYLTRPVATSLEQLKEACGEVDSGNSEDDEDDFYSESERILDGLLLEVQRSLDYYESTFAPAPPSNLLIGPMSIEVPNLVTYLSQNLAVNVHAIDLNDALNCDKNVPATLQVRTLTAIGGALLDPEINQQIDLFDEQFHTEEVTFDADDMLKTLGAWFGLLMLIFVAGWFFSLRGVKSELADVEARKAEIEQKNADLRQQYPPKVLDENLEAQVESLEADVDNEKSLNTAYNRQGRLNQGGFSNFLEGLARQPVEGLWLRRIEVSNGGAILSLEGSSTGPEKVPAFIKQLREEPAFQGKEFKSFRIDTTEGGSHINFTLQTKPEKTRR